MKGMAAALFILSVLAGYANAQETAQETVWLQQHALLAKGTTIVPLREIAEWTGAQVEWQRPNIAIKKGEKHIVLTVGSRIATSNGQKITLPIPPRLIKGITFIPLRFVGEALGANVEFQKDVREVVLRAGTKTARIFVDFPHRESLTSVKPTRSDYQRLLAKERSLSIPRKGTLSVEDLFAILRERAALAEEFKGALESGKITKEQYDELMSRNQRHSLGYE